MLSLDDMVAQLTGLPTEQREQTVKQAHADIGHLKWLPSPGPQTDAYFSEADVLLYGGQGGGGKTDLGLGLAFTAHRRSLLLRRKYANLTGLIERAKTINGGDDGFSGKPPPLIRTHDGRYIQFAGNQHLGDEQDWQGQPFDLKYFDEATQFLELQVRFHLGWLRDAEDPNQRVRAVLGSNPPVSAEGDWIIGMFRPWLDITYGKRAKPGELRYYVRATDANGKDTDLEIPVEELHRDREGRLFADIQGTKMLASSRTFIPAALKDNPFLIKTGYQAKLDALPEPLRSAVRDGNFMAARQDAAFQIIPAAWIVEAQKRWTPDGWKTHQMSAMGFDPAGGGKDSAVLAWRHYGWYAPLHAEVGDITAESTAGAIAIFENRRDNAPVVVDVGGGYAGAVSVRLKDNGVTIQPFNGAGETFGRALKSKIPFSNKRAEAWWRFREALDPEQDGGSVVALPPDAELAADLLAPCLNPRVLEAGQIQVESKLDLRKRLGRSPDKGDAVVMCWSEGGKAIRKLMDQQILSREQANNGGYRVPQTQTYNPNRDRNDRYARGTARNRRRESRNGGGSGGGEQG